jgi:type VI protein secretion system component VasK
MDSIFSIGAFILLIGLIVLVIIVQQFQQNRQYAEIQARLREIRDAELREQKANALRAERTAVMDPVTMLEATVQSRKDKSLTDEELYQVESARTRVKAITDELMHNQQWLGTPYDLEWHELLERIPLVRGAFCAPSG